MAWPPSDAEIDELARGLFPRLRDLRRDLHAHPELGFEETRTQGIVDGFLREFGYGPRAAAGTGVVADLLPERATPSVALRADLDCLPMDEATPLPHRSVTPGRAHKCGHDGHTAILLGVAAVLARARASAPWNVRLLFQPAEEGVRGGGARPLIAEGALEGVREIYGLHNWPAFPAGELRVRAGAVMARTHELTFEVEGVGGHGSAPEVCRDPIVAACALVGALQTVVSRGLGPAGGAVVSVCSFHAGTTTNVIPGAARLSGTLRTFDDETTGRVLERIREVTAGIASTYGVQVRCDARPGYPVLENHPDCVEAVHRAAAPIFGADHVTDLGLPMGGAEDFAYYTQAIPGAYFFLGAGRPGPTATPGCHHPDFDFDDQLIVPAIRVLVGILRDRASQGLGAVG